MSQTTAQAPAVEIVEEDAGAFATVTRYIIDFQRRANAEIATHMSAIERGDDLGAFFLGLAIAFAYGVIHAFGPGHGKFVIVSYFLGREVRVVRGIVMAAQVAIVHVIAAVIIVWLADAVLQSRLRDRALRGAGGARRELPDHRRHRRVHAVPGGAGVDELRLPTQGPGMGTATATVTATVMSTVMATITATAMSTATVTGTVMVTVTATVMGTVTAVSKAASWPWRPAWSRARGRC